VQAIPNEVALPSFPIWSDEFGATYPYVDKVPSDCSLRELREHLNGTAPLELADKEGLLRLFPTYARTEGPLPVWKQQFIRQNRDWYGVIYDHIPEAWLQDLRASFPPSLRKLEWNCQGEERNLWSFVLQFRPSGLRAKRFEAVPALVAMTTTQIPILGPMGRFITRVEGLRLQGLDDDHALPSSREAAFRALGNAVHVEVAVAVAGRLIAEIADHPSNFIYERSPLAARLQQQLPIASVYG
jgi:DNA (cytosine-5)-methyltransferase 1